MQRIPNPVSDLDIFIRVFREIHQSLKHLPDFSLDNISRAMIERNNVTSQGAIGDEALRRSTREDRSRDPIYNQSKAYAELFRTLGWIQSTSSKLQFCFSLLGENLIAAHNPSLLLKECLLGIAYPNEVLGVQSDQTLRIMRGILLVMDSNGSITRDEMIAGPMSISDDTDALAFDQMVTTIQSCRNNTKKLDAIIDSISKQRRITRSPTMENYTRFPIAALSWAGWGVKKKGIIEITDEGKLIAARLRQSVDVRLSDFNKLPDTCKPAFIRWTFYSMLYRSGFNLDSVSEGMKHDETILKDHGQVFPTDVTFSPFQQLSRDSIRKWVPEFTPEFGTSNEKATELIVDAISNGSNLSRERTELIFELSEKVSVAADNVTELIKEIKLALESSGTLDGAVEILFSAYSSANKNIFYPLVANLFCVLGFDCRVSRGGQNYDRADAIILDSKYSIPIEIKSPGEETEISVKGVRQALENKVVLLSRKNYPTDQETTSLVVGFNPPNDRSEVHELIVDIQKTFNIKIGVIDFRSLLLLAANVVESQKELSLHNFSYIQGVIIVKRLIPT